jgi:hypothetical protein
MTKIVPPNTFADDLKRVDPTPALKEIGATRARAFDVAVDEITVLPEFNPRITGTADHEAHIKALVDSIAENGFMPNKPLMVLPVEEDVEGEILTVFYLIAGHSRFAAIQKFNETADPVEKITTIPVVTTDQSMAELLIGTVHDNNVTKPLSPTELAIVVRRLLGYDLSKTDIAKRLSMTARYVDDLLVLDGAPAKIKEAVRAGKMSATLAVQTIRAEGEKAGETVEKAVKEAAAAGKAKVTPKQMAAKAAPKKDAAKAKVAKAAKAANAAKPAAKPKPSAKPADPVKAATEAKVTAKQIAEAAANPLPASDADFYRGAIEYALSLPKKSGVGLDWLAKVMAEDATAVGELESWLGQPKGAFFDVTLRVPVDKDGM